MGSLDHIHTGEGVLLPLLHMPNGLTAINTALLLTTGVLAGYAVHTLAMSLLVLATLLLHTLVALGLLFLAVQCLEYSHLYWCIHTCRSRCTYAGRPVHGIPNAMAGRVHVPV